MKKLNIEGFEGLEALLTPFDDDDIITDESEDEFDPFAPPEEPELAEPIEIPDINELFMDF